MPVNGKRFEVYCLEYKASASASVSESGDGDPIYSYRLRSNGAFTPDAVRVEPGIQITIESGFDGTDGVWSIEAKMIDPGYPILGFDSWVYTDGGAVFDGDIDVAVRFYGFRQYGRELGSAMRVEWDSIKVSINGGAEVTVGSAWAGDGGGTGPNYPPFHGIPYSMDFQCTGSRINVPPLDRDPCDPGAGVAMSWSTHTTGTGTISYRYKETAGGSWIALPVKVPTPPSVSSSGAPFGLSLSGIITGTSSDSVSVNGEHLESQVRTYEGRETGTMRCTFRCFTIDGDLISTYVVEAATGARDECTNELVAPYQDVYKTRSITQNKYGEVSNLPNNERSIVFLGDDTRAQVYRAAVPNATMSAGRSWANGAVIGSVDTEVEPYPEMAELLSTVTGVGHKIFTDLFGKQIIAPASATNEKSDITTYDLLGSTSLLCPPPGVDDPECEGTGFWSPSAILPDHPIVTKTESVAFEFPHAVGDLPGYQNHVVPVARYYASWPNPHWHLAYFPTPVVVDGSPVDWADYLGPLQEQWLENAALPAGERTLTRNHIVGTPLEEGQGNTPFLNDYFGGLRWIGVSRPKLLTVDLPSSVTLGTAKPGLWGARIQSGTPDCTVTSGAGGITLSGFNVPTAYVDLALAQWSNAPYLQLLLAKRITASWSGTNVSVISVHLVAADGTESASLSSSSGHTFDVPRGTPGKYAGTWAYPWGVLAVTDTGTDEQASGDSASAVTDALRMTGSMLGSDQTWASLRFKVTPTNTALNVSLNWPVFELWNTHPELIWESGKYCSMLWPLGPAIRWGTQTWYLPLSGLQDPPVSSPPGAANTVVDALSYWYRLTGAGGTLTSTLPTDLAALYDSFEGQSIGEVDKNSSAWLLPKGSGNTVRIALVSSLAEQPPLALFPSRKLNTSTWVPDGSVAQVTYDLVEEHRKLISPKASIVADPSGTAIGSAMASPPSGWFVWRYAPPLTNNETDYHVRAGTTNYGKIRPWHGFYWTGGESEPVTGSGPANTHCERMGFYFRAHVASGNIVISRSHTWAPPFDYVGEITSGSDDSQPAIDVMADGDLSVAWIRDGHVRHAISTDDGHTIGDIEDHGVGEMVRTTHDEFLGFQILAWFVYNSGSSGPGRVKIKRRARGEDSWESPWTIPIDIEPSGFDITAPPHSGGPWLLTAIPSGGTEPAEYESTDDCETFTIVV